MRALAYGVDLEEIASVRMLLAPFVAVRVQERLTDRNEAELRKLVKSMTVAARRGDSLRLFELDRRFHEKLWQLSDHKLLAELVSQLRGWINRFLRAANMALDPAALEAHARTHGELLDAIASGDRGVAEAAMAEHVRIAAARISAALPAE